MTKSSDAGLSPALVETVAGLSAGSMATLIVHPLDIVKTRMQIHRSSPTNPSAALTTVSVFRSLAQTDRPLAALYRGLTPNLIGNATSWASFFFFKSRFEQLIAHLKAPPSPTPSISFSSSEDVTTQRETQAQIKSHLSPTDFFAASLLAGAATQIITNPIWVLKTRMLSTDRAAADAYQSMFSGAVRLFRSEGIVGFYRGLGVGMLAVSHGAVQFAVYDPARRMYIASRDAKRRLAGQDVAQDGEDERISNEATIVLSTVAKLVAGTATYPLQVMRARLQHHLADELFGRGIGGVIVKLWREEGFRGFYRGMMPGVVRVLPATWVTFLVYENVKYYLPKMAGGM
ncbi:mitochondrial carrier domain-containing protein [Pseudoneurospora amorphoporcata]|uniref:Mitochondrial carrier domain-containing protein n=1 Tax=Pseudoneurospora amorphoporcata TaxID=241081 RepID=A0AAN6SC84_9PEZI|nr:mitochondrial carrier domain-containing protein [Pseudoneurospora amorphoporcata]